MNATRLLVTAAADGAPLVEFLGDALGLSRKKAKALLDDRRVFVNRQRVWMARHTVHRNDAIEVLPSGPGAGARNPPKILLECEEFLVVAKPPGTLANGPHSLEGLLRGQRREPGLVAVHRLDRDTSGCLLLARSAATETALKELFKTRGVSKVYEAIARGRVPVERATLRGDLDGKSAVTHLTLLASSPVASHLRLHLETGRTHQIRKHLSGLKCPVVGDKEYGPRRDRNDVLRNAPRQMLHASSLRFLHPATGERISARCPLPADFRTMLKQLRLT